MDPSAIRDSKFTLKNSCDAGGSRRALEESIRQLERRFETNVESGLITTEAERRLSKKESEYYAKAKKRLWHLSVKRECNDPLFFFQIYLCFFFLFSGEKYGMISWFAFFATAALKGRQIMGNYRSLRERNDKKEGNALVLRDGIYRQTNVRSIVTGDIVRIKRGEKVPVSVWSVQNPGNKYWEGEVFPEESGKVIACGRTALTQYNLNHMDKPEKLLEQQENPKDGTEFMDMVEGNILYALCGFSFLFLVYGWISRQPGSFQWMYLIAASVSGALAIAKEIIGIRVSSLN